MNIQKKTLVDQIAKLQRELDLINELEAVDNPVALDSINQSSFKDAMDWMKTNGSIGLGSQTSLLDSEYITDDERGIKMSFKTFLYLAPNGEDHGRYDGYLDYNASSTIWIDGEPIDIPNVWISHPSNLNGRTVSYIPPFLNVHATEILPKKIVEEYSNAVAPRYDDDVATRVLATARASVKAWSKASVLDRIVAVVRAHRAY